MTSEHTTTAADLPGMLGLQFAGASKGRLVGRMQPSVQHVDGSGSWHQAIVVALAEAVVARAADLKAPAGARTLALHSETDFIGRSARGTLEAEAVPVVSGPSTMKWETTVRDDEGQRVAVVSQTRLIVYVPPAASGEPDEAVALPSRRNPAPTSSDEMPVHREVLKAEPVRPAAAPSTQEVRRAQILHAAFKVISRKGFSNASTREIAHEAGMSVPAMYQYVRSKDELLEAIFSTYLGKIESGVQQSTRGVGSATAKLRAAIAVNMDQFDRYQAEIRVMNSESLALRPEVRRRVKQHLLGYISRFKAILDEGVASGEFRPVDTGVYANFIPLLCDVWPLRNWALGGRGVENVQEAVIDLMLHALTPERARKKTA